MSEAERKEGSLLIEEKIREMFSSAEKTVENIQWNLDRGGKLDSGENHTIHVTVDGKELKLLNVPRERIEDYPGGAGNEKLNANIRKLVNQVC